MDRHGGIVKKQMVRMQMSFVERQNKAAHDMQLGVPTGRRVEFEDMKRPQEREGAFGEHLPGFSKVHGGKKSQLKFSRGFE